MSLAWPLMKFSESLLSQNQQAMNEEGPEQNCNKFDPFLIPSCKQYSNHPLSEQNVQQ